MTAASWPEPWPISDVVDALRRRDTLAQLIAPRRVASGHDVRENSFENLVKGLMVDAFGSDCVIMRKQARSILRLASRDFPGTTQPDVAVVHEGSVHICELKSNRVDYSRFDCVFDSKPFREYLQSTEHRGQDPWEVEQDLIKLHLYKSLSDRVGSCLFLMVDAYRGEGRSWTRAFQSRSAFAETMRTALARGWADRLLSATRIVPIEAPGASARLIVCEVHPWH